MRILLFSKLTRIVLFAIAFLGVCWLGFNIFTVTQKPEWKFSETDTVAVQQKLVGLTLERKRIDHWNNLLEDRSKAWTSMEAVARLFPEKSGLMVKSLVHNVQPEKVPGQAKVGFVKEWIITGLAREEARSYLNTLNTREGISAHFSEIFKITGNLAYDPTPITRSIVVNVRTQENSQFRQLPQDQIIDSDETTYPFSFSLTITQRFQAADPLAIAAAKAP
jgi:hypothetical protein